MQFFCVVHFRSHCSPVMSQCWSWLLMSFFRIYGLAKLIVFQLLFSRILQVSIRSLALGCSCWNANSLFWKEKQLTRQELLRRCLATCISKDILISCVILLWLVECLIFFLSHKCNSHLWSEGWAVRHVQSFLNKHLSLQKQEPIDDLKQDSFLLCCSGIS